MRTYFHTLTATTALVALLLPATGHASASAQVTLTNLSITLIDLRPDDGVGPSIQFGGEGTFGPTASGRIYAIASNSGNEIYSNYFNNSGPFSPFSDTSGQVGGSSNHQAYASFTADSEVDGPHQLMARSTATSPGAGVNAYAHATVIAPGYYGQSFLLSPYTLVVFQGSMEGFASVDHGDGLGSSAGGYIEMTSWGIGISGQPISQQRSTDKATFSASEGEFNSTSRAVSVSFHNNSALGTSGQFNVTGYTYANDLVTPVPEASGIAMALGGLAVLAMAGRRRMH